MFESILVLLDSKSSDSLIAQYAVDFAVTTHARIKLAYMMDAEDSSTFPDPIAWSLRKAEISDALEELVQQLALKQVDVTTTVLDNQPIETLSQQMDLTDVGLIIIAKPSGNIDNKLYTLMKTTSIPILYVPTSERSNPHFHNILVPLDGSQRAECTLPLIQALCQSFNSNIVLAHIVQPPSVIFSQGTQDSELDLVKHLIESAKEKATHYLTGFASLLYAHTDKMVIVNSNVAASIHQIIDDAGIELVVLSAHGESGEPNLPFGSITHKLISYAPVPVLVVQDLPELTNLNHTQVMTQRRTPKRRAV